MRTTAQWTRAIDHCPNGRRTMQASTRPGAQFTKGNRAHWSTGITAPMLNAGDEAVRYARHPMADIPEPAVKIIRHARNLLLCPGCGIERPSSTLTCDTCAVR